MKLSSELAVGDKIYVVGIIRTVTAIEKAPADQYAITFDDLPPQVECQNRRWVLAPS